MKNSISKLFIESRFSALTDKNPSTNIKLNHTIVLCHIYKYFKVFARTSLKSINLTLHLCIFYKRNNFHE